jgi:serine/threonine protein kinase
MSARSLLLSWEMSASPPPTPWPSIGAADPASRRAGSVATPTLAGWPPPPSPDAPARSEDAASDAATSELRALGPGTYVGRFIVQRRLAHGGMGTLWAAVDTESGEPVVVKMLALDLLDNEEAVGRFEQEAELVRAIASPHIVRFIDHGVFGGAPYIVLERLHGEDLEERLRRGPLTLDETASIAEGVACGLLVAHLKGIVHRDVKPSNIFLAEESGGDVAKLLDFGIAKLRDGQRIRTGAGVTVGSPEFMSPEQIQGRSRLDGRSDVFSLAAVLYTCLTGKMPFTGATIADTFHAVLGGDFVPPTRIRPELPPAVDALFTKAFSVAPEDRFLSAPLLAAELRAIADDARFNWRGAPPKSSEPPRWLGASSSPPPRIDRTAEARSLVLVGAIIASMIGLWAAVDDWTYRIGSSANTSTSTPGE